MYEYKGFKYALVVIDLFSLKIQAEALKTKSAANVKAAFEKIFAEFGATPEKLSTGNFITLCCRPFFLANSQPFCFTFFL